MSSRRRTKVSRGQDVGFGVGRNHVFATTGKLSEAGSGEHAGTNFGAEIKPQQKAGLEIDEDGVARPNLLPDGGNGFGHVGTALVFPRYVGPMWRARNLADRSHQKSEAQGIANLWRVNFARATLTAAMAKGRRKAECRVPP